jgi:hypothetical protein
MFRLLYLSFFLSIIFSFGTATAQDFVPNFNEGFVIYEIRPAGNSSIPEIYKETTLTLYVKDNKTKLDLNILGGFATIQILEGQSSENIALVDFPMLSEKSIICLNRNTEILSGLNVSSKVNKAPKRNPKIEIYQKDKTKILGKSTYKAIVPLNSCKSKAAMYLSKKMTLDTPEFIEYYTGELPGLPLHAELTVFGERVILTAKEIRKTKISDRVFEIPKDYKQKSAKEFKRDIEEFIGVSDAGSEM